MDWFKKHIDAVLILSAVVSSVIWMNGRFNDVDKQFAQVDKQLAELHEEMAVMKTVLIMKKIMPVELAKEGE